MDVCFLFVFFSERESVCVCVCLCVCARAPSVLFSEMFKPCQKHFLRIRLQSRFCWYHQQTYYRIDLYMNDRPARRIA